jgi:hypothetical protein
MKLPFNREAMRERNLLDDIDEIEDAIRRTPGERFQRTLSFSESLLAIALQNVGQDALDRSDRLDEKARLWAAPLRAIARR